MILPRPAYGFALLGVALLASAMPLPFPAYALLVFSLKLESLA